MTIHQLPTPVVDSIDLTTVAGLIDGAGKAVENLNGQTTPRDRTSVAHASRQLLCLADQLALASCVVRNEYWSMKGMSDVLI